MDHPLLGVHTAVPARLNARRQGMALSAAILTGLLAATRKVPLPPPFCGEKKSNLGQQSRHLQCVLPFDLSIRGPRRMEMYLGEQPLTAARWLTEKEINKSDHQTDFPSAVAGGGGKPIDWAQIDQVLTMNGIINCH